jgi:hypothetical protein
MSKKLLNTEAVENAKRNQIEEIDGWKLGEEIWARLSDGSIGQGKITTLHDAASGKSATFFDTVGSKFRTVYLVDLSREEIKGRRKSKGKGAAGTSVGIMKLRLTPEESGSI